MSPSHRPSNPDVFETSSIAQSAAIASGRSHIHDTCSLSSPCVDFYLHLRCIIGLEPAEYWRPPKRLSSSPLRRPLLDPSTHRLQRNRSRLAERSHPYLWTPILSCSFYHTYLRPQAGLASHTVLTPDVIESYLALSLQDPSPRRPTHHRWTTHRSVPRP